MPMYGSLGGGKDTAEGPATAEHVPHCGACVQPHPFHEVIRLSGRKDTSLWVGATRAIPSTLLATPIAVCAREFEALDQLLHPAVHKPQPVVRPMEVRKSEMPRGCGCTHSSDDIMCVVRLLERRVVPHSVWQEYGYGSQAGVANDHVVQIAMPLVAHIRQRLRARNEGRRRW